MEDFFMSNLKPFTEVYISETDSKGNKRIYDMLLSCAFNARAKKLGIPENNTSIDDIVSHIIQYLESTDFYTTPASKKYHDAFNGGLLYHSLCVYNKMLELIQIPTFSSVDVASATLVTLTHDWCKIGIYTPYMKNIKDESGNWTQQLSYQSADNHLGLGHSTQSLIMLMQFCNTPYTKLSFDEMAAIKWHMGSWDISQYDQEDFNKCNSNIPLVKLIQFADQLACTQF